MRKTFVVTATLAAVLSGAGAVCGQSAPPPPATAPAVDFSAMASELLKLRQEVNALRAENARLKAQLAAAQAAGAGAGAGAGAAPAATPTPARTVVRNGADMRDAVPADMREPSTDLQRNSRDEWVKNHFQGLTFDGTVTVRDVGRAATGGQIALSFMGSDGTDRSTAVLGTAFFPAKDQAALGKLRRGQKVNVRGAIKAAYVPLHDECSVTLESATFTPVPGQ